MDKFIESPTGVKKKLAEISEGIFAEVVATVEQTAQGFDPSTGRVPVEQMNNGAFSTLTNSTYTAVVKAAPGYVKGVTISTHGTVTATHLVIYDNTAASGSNIIDLLKLPPTTETLWIDEDTLATTGISIALCTVNPTTGAITNAAAGPSGCVTCSIAYR